MKGFLEKITKFLLFLFLLLIPTQLGRHFWPEWSYVLGIRVDYLSPTLYLIDIIWIVLLISNFQFLISKIKTPQSRLKSGQLPLTREPLISFKNLLILGFVGVNVLMAVNPWVAIYKWLRVGQILITFFYFRKNKELIKGMLTKIIPCWIIFESLLAVAQMANNGSLNGIFYWLGERSFSFNTIGIAQMSVMGRGLIRAYGTFSHPNSLAGFLLVGLLLMFRLRVDCKKDGRAQDPPLQNVFYWGVVWLGLLGILVSGSRTIWVLTLVLILGLILVKIKNNFNKIALFLVFLGVLVFALRLINLEYRVSDFLGGWDTDGIKKRIQLNMAGIKMIKESPWFGVGLGNFLVRLPEFQKNNGVYWLQPVHNILILAWSQVGILGLFLGFLFFNKNINYKRINLIFKIIFGVVIISGLVDHYWLTLPQNVWLLVLVLGIV